MGRILCLLLVMAAWLAADDIYDGPPPPKADLPYLLHATKLTETEVAKAREETRKNETVYVIPGATSPVRTPLPEPIFILSTQKIAPENLELYELEVKDGNREMSVSTKGHPGTSRVLHLRVTPMAEHLFRVEASESLENGEYALAPNGENRVFCFEVY